MCHNFNIHSLILSTSLKMRVYIKQNHCHTLPWGGIWGPGRRKVLFSPEGGYKQTEQRVKEREQD